MVAALIDFPRTGPRPVGDLIDHPSQVERTARPGCPEWGETTDATSSRSRELRATYRRRRIVAAGLVVATLLLVLIALQAALGRSGGGPLTTIGSAGGAQPAAAHLVVVRPGDTLWSIALATGARGDIRPLVDRLSAEVGGRPLQAGQQILVP